jgi:hypothetical protein
LKTVKKRPFSGAFFLLMKSHFVIQHFKKVNVMATLTLIDTVPCANLLGEGVQWNHQDGCFWWTDIPSSKLYRYRISDKNLSIWDMPERLCCFTFAKNDARILAVQLSGLQNRKRELPETVRTMAVVIARGVSGWVLPWSKKILLSKVPRFIVWINNFL